MAEHAGGLGRDEAIAEHRVCVVPLTRPFNQSHAARVGWILGGDGKPPGWAGRGKESGMARWGSNGKRRRRGASSSARIFAGQPWIARCGWILRGDREAGWGCSARPLRCDANRVTAREVEPTESAQADVMAPAKYRALEAESGREELEESRSETDFSAGF